jgi:hypothetical protein
MLKGLSGFDKQWDNEKGMNIRVDEADAWNEYCMVCHINFVIVPLIYTF